MTRRTILVAALAVTLAACSQAPTREQDPEGYRSLVRAQIPAAKVQPFADCLLEGFKRAHGAGSNYSATLTRRGPSYRAETIGWDGRVIAASADLFDSGALELFASNRFDDASVAGERAAFRRCVERMT